MTDSPETDVVITTGNQPRMTSNKLYLTEWLKYQQIQYIGLNICDVAVQYGEPIIYTCWKSLTTSKMSVFSEQLSRRIIWIAW